VVPYSCPGVYLDGDAIGDDDSSEAGIAAYLDAARVDPDFETIVLPLGEGIAVSVKRRDGDAKARSP